MTEHNTSHNSSENATFVLFIVRTVICLLILGVGVVGFIFFSSLRPVPKEKQPEDLLKTLIGMTVVEQPVTLKISGYGTAVPATTTDMSSEVKGKVVYISPKLNDGDLVQKGEVLVRIEKRDYEILHQQAEAEIKNLNAELAVNRQRIKDTKLVLGTIKNDLELEESDLKRKENLSKKGVISTLALEDSKQAVENKRNLLITTEGRIEEDKLNEDAIKARLLKAQAIKEQAELDITRCQITSPFHGRIENVSIDEGEYVNVGQKMFDISNDSELEIPISLNAREVSKILNLKIPEGDAYRNWFTAAKGNSIPVTVEWTENPQKCIWQAKILRVEKYDSETRTLVVVVSPEKFVGEKDKFFPLVDGMFCKATFAGESLPNAVKVPWNAIQLDGKVYVVDNKGIISEREIQTANSQDDGVIASSGLKNGELLVTQRLPRGIINGMRVKVIPLNQTQSVASDQAPSSDAKKKSVLKL